MSCPAKLVNAGKTSYSVFRSLSDVFGAAKLPFPVFSSVETRRRFCGTPWSQNPEKIIYETSKSQKTRKSSKSGKTRMPSKESSSHSENIIKYLKDRSDHLTIESIPKKYLKKTHRYPEGYFVIGDETATVIAENVISHGISTPVFEVNPGPGLVTKALLEKGAHEIHCFQSPAWSKPCELFKNNPTGVHLHHCDFFNLWKRLLLESSDNDKDLQALMSVLKPRPWKEDPPMKIFAAIPKKFFINHVIAAMVFQKGFLLHGRPEFYLVMEPYDYHCLTCDSSAGYKVFQSISVLFQIFCEEKLLCRLPRKDFIPWVGESITKRGHQFKINEDDADSVYFVKITLRQDLHEVVQGAGNLKALWHFVRQCFTKRRNRVIPYLENWIPGCGVRLIFRNMTIYTTFGELSPQETLELFQLFSSWPEYPDCPFLASLETLLLKSYVESNPDVTHESEFDTADDTTELYSDFDVIPDGGTREKFG